MKTRQLVHAALEQGLLATIVPLCRDGKLEIYRLNPFSGKLTLDHKTHRLYLRVTNGKLHVSAGEVTYARHFLSSWLVSKQGQIVEHEDISWSLSVESMASWCYWLAQAQHRLETKQRVCRVPVQGQAVYLCKLTVLDMCALVNGPYRRHWQWTRRLLYLYLELGCDGR